MLVQFVSVSCWCGKFMVHIKMRELLLIPLALCVCFAPHLEAKTCSSLDIRNDVTELEKLRGCSVVAGSVQIVLMDSTDPKLFDNYVFPELKEVTEYLLFYRVHNLTNIGKLFPNLSVIRGRVLFMNYALVIFEMYNLVEIGLYSLTRIFRGAVRIEKNFKLCYLPNINWTLVSDAAPYLANNANLCSEGGKCPAECPAGCWNDQRCQQVFNNSCPGDCLYGCKKNDPNYCEICKFFTEDHRCVTNCSANRYSVAHLNRCVTEDECRVMEGNWWIFGQECLDKCPKDFERANDTCVRCKTACPKACNGTHVTNIDSMQEMEGCTNITGDLHIRIDTESISNLDAELEKYLGSIEEIRGYLRIYRTISIRNLNFLKKLRIIRGARLEQDNYALIVHDNSNLQKLWDPKNLNLTILNGTFSFHYNRKLCYSEIENLAHLINLKQNYTSVDVSNHSNGDDFACMPINIEVNVAQISENNVTVEWLPVRDSANNVLTRYLVFYKEVDYRDTYFEDEVCGLFTWMINFTSHDISYADANEKLTWNITNLRTFTNYTYYIRTDDKQGGRSRPQYLRTLSGDPSIPLNIMAAPVGSDSIRISWEKPTHYNGILSHYSVFGFIQLDEQHFIDNRDYCTNKMVEVPRKTEFVIKKTVRPVMINGTCVCNKEQKHRDIEVADFDAICADLHRYRYNNSEGEQPHNCASYKHLYISNYQKQPEEDEIEKREGTTLAPYKDYLSEFQKYVGLNDTYIVIEKLKHYSIYVVMLAACNENRTEKAQCSSVVMVSQRTGRKANADDIVDLKVTVVDNKYVDIDWTEPPNPNSIIVSYEVTFRRLNSEKSQNITECVTRFQHELSGNRYRLGNLSDGDYMLSVRTTSLAGSGNYTIEHKFSIDTSTPTSPAIPIVIVFLLLIIAAVIVFLYYRFRVRQIIYDDIPLVANVNPDYAGFEIEDRWCLRVQDLEMGEEIGHGTFGVVCKGMIKGENIPCAIKTLNNDAGEINRIDFLTEASCMKQFVECVHVVRFIGVVPTLTRPMVVMELMERGDLKTYLRELRENATVPLTQVLSTAEMYRMAAEIADGMAYLSEKKFTHRDLAARNCMINLERMVKVGDFGMARDIYETDYYRKGNKGLLPVRWMAPESLADGMFTCDSDCWSYGVVLWEIVTLAQQPYQGMSNDEVLQYVTSGMYLSRPDDCPEILHQIMLECWHWAPRDRPQFTDIIRELVKSVGPSFQYVSSALQEDASYRSAPRRRDDNIAAVVRNRLWIADEPTTSEEVPFQEPNENEPSTSSATETLIPMRQFFMYPTNKTKSRTGELVDVGGPSSAADVFETTESTGPPSPDSAETTDTSD